MKVIVFAATKGGTGKTTLAFNAGVYATERGHSVYLVDRDPQASLTGIWRLRKDRANPMLIDDVTSVMLLVRMLVEKGRTRDYLIVDTPGSMMPIITDAIAAADLICLPVQNSPLDVAAQAALAGTIQKLGLWNRTMFIANRTGPSSRSVRERLKSITQLPIPGIIQRYEYSQSVAVGQAAWEPSADTRAGHEPATRVEIGKLWQAMQVAMGQAADDPMQAGDTDEQAT